MWHSFALVSFVSLGIYECPSLLLPYTMNKLSFCILAPVCDYSQHEGTPETDLQMCGDNSINICVTTHWTVTVSKQL